MSVKKEAECFESCNIESPMNVVATQSLSKAALRCKSATMDDRLDQLTQSVRLLSQAMEDMRKRVAEFEQQTKSLEDDIMRLREDVNTLEPSPDLIIAMNLVKSVERRFIDLLVKGTDERYSRVSYISEDVQDGDADAIVAARWERHKTYWDVRLLSRLIRDLTESLGWYTGQQDLARFADWTPLQVRAALKGLEWRVPEDQIRALLRAHSLTATRKSGMVSVNTMLGA